eukprot:CAMPEP_0170480424 /NCGR_PEP_ID=MMETSP0208-20121228/1269_1 /TAXON_ID=197538 /ORGANISM="Strombidium inclinatum, Strain S3" /LENGTH=198 /DNA_ID=CAMNT_0010752973 /DNA_START=349 /DNA_END=945 /DNA_ORIENTATION=+
MNIRSKANEGKAPMSLPKQVKTIWASEGVFGFGKGISACLYGSIIQGMVYFYTYKWLKLKMFELMGKEVSPTLVFMTASVLAEVFTLIVHFPFDMIKCRFQSMNHHYKYKSLPHAFIKEVGNRGVCSLYQGVGPFFATYVTFVGLQFTIYESYMDAMKKKYSKDDYQKHELSFNFYAGFLAGSVAAFFTNPLEVVTVN